jgi:N-[(2S)-2-amino-2-carboxyethyl]-L-glutamate dehydrogenase
MLYLNDRDLQELGQDWPALVDMAEAAVRILDTGDYAQPVKPYLRYGNPKNRIIAMPAYLGEQVNTAGIKWIASFPDNIRSGLPRAHSVTILNDALTGQPAAILNSPLASIIRTASVSGVMLRHYLAVRPHESMELGIIGWGPIGKYHYHMAMALYGDRITRVRIYDIKECTLSDLPPALRDKTEVAESWEEAYLYSNVFMTCTVSEHRYIDLPPRQGSLLLHVSLRDYKPEALAGIKAIIVDDWNEVCRENTDMELLHLQLGLERSGTQTLADVVCRGYLNRYDIDEPILFSPMGMAVFDMATAAYLVRLARAKGMGTELF